MGERIGMVGMGLMGQAMIKNLTEAGFSIQGFDVDPARMQQLREQGGEPVGSPADAARDVRFLLTSLPNSAVVREVVGGANGVVAGADDGLLIVDTTTSRPEDSVAVAEELAGSGIRFLDACVSGTSVMAREKDLIVIAGGSAEDFEAARALLAGFSRAAYYMGPAGSGALTKLIINLVLIGNMFALAEGMLLGQKAGVDTQRLLTVLKDSAAGSKAMDQKGEMMATGVYEPITGTLATSNKDVGRMLEQGRKLGSPLFLIATYAQLAFSAQESGMGEREWACGALELLREMAGLDRRV